MQHVKLYLSDRFAGKINFVDSLYPIQFVVTNVVIKLNALF